MTAGESSPGKASRLRHYAGFLLGGALAGTTDAAVLEGLTRFAGLSPFSARPIGIMIAMVVSWLVNRHITFAVSRPPTLSEFFSFAAVVWFAQAVNYAVFAAILLIWQGTMPLIALIIACLVSMFVSYAGYRYGVFERGTGGRP